MDKIDECYKKAKEVIKLCSNPNGLFASAGKEGYDAVWARDSMISMIGASLVEDNEYKNLFKETFKKSIITLSSGQSKNGQIPNCVDKFSKRKSHVDYKSIDSSLWYIIGNYVYKNHYHDSSLFNRYKNSIEKSLMWLSCQDLGENLMLTQLPTSDWQDAFPHKYGYTINTLALWFKVLNNVSRKDDAKKLSYNVNNNPDVKLWNGEFYVPYRWKNHGKFREIGDWFDSNGNMLAILFNLASQNQVLKILDYIENNKINRPYPLRTIYPPIKTGSKNWQDYFSDCEAGEINHYSNGGIWGYHGGFYVVALIKAGKFDKAKKELELLAEKNLNGNFPEWTNPITKEHHGCLQAWEAGSFILAYECLKKRKVLL